MKIYVLAECTPEGYFEQLRILSEEEFIIKPEEITETPFNGTYYTEIANTKTGVNDGLFYLEYKVFEFPPGYNPWEGGLTIKPY